MQVRTAGRAARDRSLTLNITRRNAAVIIAAAKEADGGNSEPSGKQI
ncbi:hypothetical protein KCP78_05965 [Salmonella enterica subsp. enterica]|nr:hypothetical protein KCP78_05965 [Salmonella enterica subsp. enterica]